MIDVSVKTLDGQTKSHSVADDTTVRQFKETIASSISIPADTQRLIFQGRVLQDEKLLKDFNVHGKVIHVVQRPPPRPNSTSPIDNGGVNSTTASAPPPPPRDVNSFVVSSFTLPSDILDPNQVQNIVQQAVHNIGELGRNARVSTRASADGSAVDVHINLGQIPVQQMNESQQRINHIRKLLHLVNMALSRLENPSANSNQQSTNNQRNSNEPVPGAPSQSGTAQPSSDDQPSTASNSQGPSPPPVTVVAELMTELQEVQRRLQPFLTQYTTLAQNDASYTSEQTEARQESERIFNGVSECLHYMSHIYHSVSDLTVDFSQSPPRHLHAHTAMPALAGLIPSTLSTGSIPVNGQYRIPGGNIIPNFSAINPGLRSASAASGTAGSHSTSGGSHTSSSSLSSNVTQSTAVPATSTTSSSRTFTSASTTPVPLITLPSTVFSTNSSQTTTAQTSSTPISLGQSFSTSSSSPYLFVEVGPDSLTVNSISAHVVSSDMTSTSTSNTSSMQRTFQVNIGPNLSTSTTTTSSMSNNTTTTAASSSSTNTSSSNCPPGGSTVTSSINVSGTPGIVSTGGTTSTTSSSSSSSSSSNSSSSSSNIGTGVGRPTVVLPGNVPNIQGLLGGQHPARTIDPYLPCVSRHFLSSQAQNDATTANVVAAAAANVAAAASQQSSNQGTDTALGDVVAAVMAGLLGTNDSSSANNTNTPNTQTQGGNAANQRPVATPVSISQISQAIGGMASPVFAMVSRNLARSQPTSTTTTTTISSTEAPLEPTTFVQALRNFFQGSARSTASGGLQTTTVNNSSNAASATNTTTTTSTRSTATASTSSNNAATTQSQSSSTSSSGTTSQTTSGTQVIPDEAIIQLIQGIINNLMQAATGQQNVGTIWDFFSTIGEEMDIEHFEGLTNDIFQCISRHLTISDLMTVLLGNSEPLNRLRTPLKELFLHQILNDAEPTEANIQNAVLQLLTEMRAEIKAIVSISEVQPNIDAEATLDNFLKHQYTKIIKLTIESEDNNEFGQSLYNWFKTFLSELIVLGRFCLVEGHPAFQRVVHDRLQHLTNGINVMMQQSLITMATLQLNGFHPQQTESDIQHYIAWKDSASAANKESAKPNPPEVTAAAAVPEVAESEAASPMEVDSETSATSQVTNNNSKPDTTTKNKESKPKLVNGVNSEETSATTTTAATVPLTLAVEQTNAAAPTTTSNGDDWCSVVPAEWVPIIRQDIQHQRRQNPQTPFSDAYLSGMPAKRRKMNPGKATNLSEVSEFVPDSLKKAVASAGVEPLSSLENLSNEAARDSILHSAFEDQMCNNVLQRIHLDSDYNPEMFPNIEEYFKKQRKSK
ncbi:large proline-rich protein BAG6 isoform X2 [Octopus bimaculoides]|uniref:Large proline-rich protein BAG6 n=1 Tax=Octopus bimaculoides TaxID=37653 RepID=A0A0L8IIM7_OCTBM|nr:large proline-rich protein BAG6 isoform X2 [Octopus bimaculoides]|eukprot:XP_014777722.1 PREDICTED: large proline-rich protein BAG6-like isoform X2 [Octopus bimaculoides]